MAETAAAIALNPDAPAAERYDAEVEATRGALASQLIPAEDIQPVIDLIKADLEEQEFQKSLRKNNVINFPDNRAKRPNAAGAGSVIVDDYQVTAQGPYWDRPGLLGFDSMRSMVDQTPILAAIVLTRIRQVTRFCRPQANKSEAGFLIQHIDPTVELDETQQRSIKLLQDFIINCGWEKDPRRRKRLKRNTFSQFMAKSVRDSLTMDACPIETEFRKDRKLGLDGFYAIDGATIRLCTEEGYEGDDEIYALQVIEGNIRSAYTYDDLVYEVRNPRTDVTACGYGFAEAEMLIRVVTYILNTLTYNGSFFDKNSIPRGIMNLVGNYSPEDLAAFKRYWQAMARGINNAHNLPILVARDGESKSEFIEIGGQLSEMAFSKWLSLLSSLACSIYGMAPEEVSLESFSAGKSALSGDDTEEKLVSSTDKGLRPLLAFYENTISDYIIQPFGEYYCLRFAGLDADDAKNRFEMRKLVCTLNEARTQEGMDPLDGQLGDAPLNQTLLGAWQQIEGIGQQQEDFGDPDAAGGELPEGGDKGGEDPGGSDGAGDGQDFGSPPQPEQAGTEDVSKSFTEADFGLPPIYLIEA